MKVKWKLYGGNYHADLGPIHFVVEKHRQNWVLFAEDGLSQQFALAIKIVGRYGSLREAKNAISLLSS